VRTGATVEPEVLVAALCACVDPRWTAGHAFAVGWDVEGDERSSRFHVLVRDRVSPTVGEGVPEDAVATVRVSEAGLSALLCGVEPPAGEQALVEGDADAAALLCRWLDRAQDAGPQAS
ncbi:MAG TPA: hypothetical protein VHB30_06105, partial [Solirubrobacteraceae bacterium]|nr:hypothetical protein [Solirubrobacteraceae bacterium]